jgi:RNA polymerase sigma factor (sigma-70 family)
MQRNTSDLPRSDNPPPDVSPRPEPDVYTVMNQTGSSDARARQFTELFGTSYGPVLAYARRRVGADMAQDIVAETFLAAWRNLHKLPPAPLPWLYRTAHFAIANQRRALARSDRLNGRARQLAESVIAPDHAELVTADLAFAAAIRSLSETDREVLRLAAWEGLTVIAIGEVIGCSPAAAKARLHRARQRLSRKLAADRPQPENSLSGHTIMMKETEK